MTILFFILVGFILAIAAPILFRWLRNLSGWILAIYPLSFAAFIYAQLPEIMAGNALQENFIWIPGLGINFSFYVDGLSVVFLLLINIIGALILIYASGYLKGDPQLNRFYAFILLFMTAMNGLVSSDNLMVLFIFWELTSISSYLLIGYKHDKEDSRSAALQALLVTGGGGLALLAGIIIIGQIAGSYELSYLFSQPEVLREHFLYLPVLLLVLAGAFTKSAQVPFHFWLPGAMAAPTPVSAYLHSATMVKAGIFLLARMNPVLGNTNEWHYLVTYAGALTMLVGAVMAVTQTDLKRLLAYSTVSALGTLVLLLGLSTTLATKAAMVFLVVHSLYKGALFMVAGSIDHETGTRDVTRLGGLIKIMPVTAIAAGLAALSMSGFPPLLGFIGKELIYEAKIQLPDFNLWVITAGVAANVVNVTVAIIVGIAPFWDDFKINVKRAHEGSVALWLGALLLAVGGLAAGLFPDIIGTQIIEPALRAVQAEQTHVKLKLWHGINPVLMLSIATVISGIVLYFLRNHLRHFAAKIKNFKNFGPQALYNKALQGVLKSAELQTRILQNGYQRYYILTILLTTILLVGYSVIRVGGNITTLHFREILFFEWILGGLIILSAFFALHFKSRLSAVIILGVVGFSIAVIFILYAAPDLAITQILVETLTVILFVFVIYHLPRYEGLSRFSSRIRDAIIAGTFGLLMSVLVIIALDIPNDPVSDFFAQNSYIRAFGRNVVNVILVDFRALDTLGEITVLAVAAFGVYALLKLKPKQGDDS